jgi:hypothetical protein
MTARKQSNIYISAEVYVYLCFIVPGLSITEELQACTLIFSQYLLRSCIFLFHWFDSESLAVS